MAGTVIDVGYSQGEFDWESAKGQIDGAVIECGFGSDDVSQDDAQFSRNVSECERRIIQLEASDDALKHRLDEHSDIISEMHDQHIANHGFGSEGTD